MNTKTTISISEARKKIFEIANEVQVPGVHYTFTEKGTPKAVLMSAEEFESWQETLEVMRDCPDLDKDIKEAKEAIKSGAYKKWITLDQLLVKSGFVVADKAKKKYGVRTAPAPKSRKKSK
jgi:prevent-host-death family protein